MDPQNCPGAGRLGHTTKIHPAGVDEVSNHKQLAHHLTVWVFCSLSFCWEISGALQCWALLIGTLERSMPLLWQSTLNPQCSTPQPGWHHAPGEAIIIIIIKCILYSAFQETQGHLIIQNTKQWYRTETHTIRQNPEEISAFSVWNLKVSKVGAWWMPWASFTGWVLPH